MGRSRYQIFNETYPFPHLNGWQPVFTRQESVQILFDSFNGLQENTDFMLTLFKMKKIDT
jgi:hypothetical protein